MLKGMCEWFAKNGGVTCANVLSEDVSNRTQTNLMLRTLALLVLQFTSGAWGIARRRVDIAASRRTQRALSFKRRRGQGDGSRGLGMDSEASYSHSNI
jgi:hypothetical protein